MVKEKIVVRIFGGEFRTWWWLIELRWNHDGCLGFLVKKMECRKAHMASVLSKTEIEYGVSASVKTRGKRLTFFGLVVIS